MSALIGMASPIPRLRAGLCDRCMVTQELARKKQLELESAHLQSLQHLCILSEPHPQSVRGPQRQPQGKKETQRHTLAPSDSCLFSHEFLGQGHPHSPDLPGESPRDKLGYRFYLFCKPQTGAYLTLPLP